MKYLLLIIVFTTALFAQETVVTKAPALSPITKTLVATFNANEDKYYNWAEGGENVYGWKLVINGGLDYTQKLWNVQNTLDIEYGRTAVGDAESIKSSDKLFLESEFNYSLMKYTGAYVAGQLNTQFTSGYTYEDEGKVKISTFFDPGYLIESVGLKYSLDKKLTSRLGFGVKQTFSSETYGWADDPETAEVEDFKNELGLESVTELKLKINDILSYKSRIAIFTNFDKVSRIDSHWKNKFSAQLLTYLTVDLAFEILYDYDIDVDTQYKQGMSLGLTYKLF